MNVFAEHRTRAPLLSYVPGLDVFGQHPIKKSQECNCPNCNRGVAASRFATHLEKCMGMGRNSSRIASRRIANNSKDLTTFSGVVSDDDDDVDWSIYNDKRKRRKDRNGFRKLKQLKSATNQRNGNEPFNEFIFLNDSALSNFEHLSFDEKKTLLQQICGVVSEHTKKLCTRSMRCPQHTDDQRKEIRTHLISSNYSGNGSGPSTDDMNLFVDIDTFEETDTQNLRETLSRWDREGSSQSSPADSASTTSTSSISKRKECKSKGKGKIHKRERTSPVSQVD
ncbi:hypothetical protein QAD02_020368 [Eretmocerus hayati]|uniref:Uncharacterized protein n=1 Tax=Eretmocerus hayati TaxID=131215 RepID=A0ACC2PM71_9HYME|nr:hypothetical protein QAD02_020368 [Eretmocerus hayati]